MLLGKLLMKGQAQNDFAWFNAFNFEANGVTEVLLVKAASGLFCELRIAGFKHVELLLLSVEPSTGQS